MCPWVLMCIYGYHWICYVLYQIQCHRVKVCHLSSFYLIETPIFCWIFKISYTQIDCFVNWNNFFHICHDLGWNYTLVYNDMMFWCLVIAKVCLSINLSSISEKNHWTMNDTNRISTNSFHWNFFLNL